MAAEGLRNALSQRKHRFDSGWERQQVQRPSLCLSRRAGFCCQIRCWSSANFRARVGSKQAPAIYVMFATTISIFALARFRPGTTTSGITGAVISPCPREGSELRQFRSRARELAFGRTNQCWLQQGAVQHDDDPTRLHRVARNGHFNLYSMVIRRERPEIWASASSPEIFPASEPKAACMAASSAK